MKKLCEICDGLGYEEVPDYDWEENPIEAMKPHCHECDGKGYTEEIDSIYILVEEYNDWVDYITTTQYKILMCSEDREKLSKYRDENCESMRDEESEIFYYIRKIPIL